VVVLVIVILIETMMIMKLKMVDNVQQDLIVRNTGWIINENMNQRWVVPTPEEWLENLKYLHFGSIE
jgi:hypothetical protein